MKKTQSPKVTVVVSHAVPVRLLQKYASQKPLRRPAPRPKRT
jgi:broad specificity phosphatase PhoE